jgi:hypothetical protein
MPLLKGGSVQSSLMRRLSFLLAATLALSPAGAALSEKEADASSQTQQSTDAVKMELTKVIEEQLAAFRGDDYAKAFTFASEQIRGALDVAQFEEMVRRGYPVIAKSSKAEFGLALDTGEETVVNVRVQAGAQAVDYQYHMVKQKDGWRIGGVTELKKDGIAV